MNIEKIVLEVLESEKGEVSPFPVLNGIVEYDFPNVAQQVQEKIGKCEWEGGIFDWVTPMFKTGCKSEYYPSHDDWEPLDDNYKHCPYCGKEIEVKE